MAGSIGTASHDAIPKCRPPPFPHSHFTGGGGTTHAGSPGGLPGPFGRLELHDPPDEWQRVSELPADLPDASRKLRVTRPPDCTLVSAEPVKRPLESRNSVLEVPPPR